MIVWGSRDSYIVGTRYAYFICMKVLPYTWKCSGRRVTGVLMDRMQLTFLKLYTFCICIFNENNASLTDNAVMEKKIWTWGQNGAGEKKGTRPLPNIYEEDSPILWIEAWKKRERRILFPILAEFLFSQLIDLNTQVQVKILWVISLRGRDLRGSKTTRLLGWFPHQWQPLLLG